MCLADFSNTGLWSQVIGHLNAWDSWLFLKINRDWTNGFLDNNYPWWRDAETWIPLYFFLLFFVFLNFGKRAWPWVAFVLLTVGITDQGGDLLKILVNRPRPCQDLAIIPYARMLLSHCPFSQSFPSNHATNHFGLAAFIFLTLKPYFKNWSYLLFIWAATICYGQVYVGIHYPLDILGGALFGCLSGYVTATIFNRRIGLPVFAEN